MTEIPDRAEVVIVGGGISGLAAAWALRDRDVQVLEATERVGGRMKSEVRDPYWLNLGAHVLKGGGPMATLAAEVGVPLVSPGGSFVTVALNGRIVKANSAEEMLLRLPLSLSARLSLARVGLRLLATQRTLDRVGPGPSPERQALERATFAEVLGPMHPDVEALMRVIANRIGGELREISGATGVHHFRQLWFGMRTNITGGSAQLPQALRRALGDRVHLGARVTCVEPAEGGVSIEVQAGEARRRLLARACILATQPPAAREIAPGMPAAWNDALGQMRYTPFLVAGIFTNETGPMPWDDLYALAVPGRSFCMFFNPANAVRQPGQPRQPGGSLVVYAVADRAAQLLDKSDDEIRDLYLEDLYDIFPEARGIVREVIIQRWPMGVFVSIPERARLRETLAQSWGGIFLAGDYMMPMDGVDASQSGSLAAEAVRRYLSQGE